MSAHLFNSCTSGWALLNRLCCLRLGRASAPAFLGVLLRFFYGSATPVAVCWSQASHPRTPRPAYPLCRFDDASASAIGAWADVRRRCEGGRIQPSVLFYEAEFEQ